MFSPRNIAIAVAIIVSVALTSIVTDHIVARRADSLRESLAVARSTVKASIARADSANNEARVQKILAEAESKRSDSLSVAASQAKSSANAAWHRFDSLAAQKVCDSVCIAAAKSARASDSIALANTQQALDAERIANARLRLGLDQTTKALDDLKSSAHKLDDVSGKIARRPSIFRRLMPHVGAGAAAGLDITGRPNVVTGVTLGWSF